VIQFLSKLYLRGFNVARTDASKAGEPRNHLLTRRAEQTGLCDGAAAARITG
jgi:hypothetical protein